MIWCDSTKSFENVKLEKIVPKQSKKQIKHGLFLQTV